MALTQTSLDRHPATQEVSWNQFGHYAGRLAKIVQASGTKFQLIGIAPNGVFIADQLSRIFDQRVAVLDYRQVDNDISKLSINIVTVEGIKNHILIINDRCEIESPLPQIVKQLTSSQPNTVIKTAVIWQYSNAPFQADFFVENIRENLKISQPFDRRLLSDISVRYEPVLIENKLYTDSEQYFNLINSVAHKIINSGWYFDHVISILRGGFYAGHALATKFKTFHSPICCSSYREENGTIQSSLLMSEIIIKIKTSRWLIVDDLVDSGKTLNAVVSEIKTNYPDVDLKTCVLWKKKGSKHEPDYVGDTVDSETWIDQFFETPVKV